MTAKYGPIENDNLLSWMIEIAMENEGDPASLGHLEMVMSLASIHTWQMNAVHCLYDLIARPEYLEEIREEVRQVIGEDGGWNGWQKTSSTNLRKLDSFMRESQRFNPPTLLSIHRVMLRSHQLSDGTVLPQGAPISMAVNAIQNDPAVAPSPTSSMGSAITNSGRRMARVTYTDHQQYRRKFFISGTGQTLVLDASSPAWRSRSYWSD